MNKWIQPVNPLKFHYRITDYSVIHHVFAIRIDGDNTEYLTIDGQFIPASKIMYAETFINGEWVSISRT